MAHHLDKKKDPETESLHEDKPPEDKPVVETPAEPKPALSGKTGHAVYEHLKATGTGWNRLELVKDFLEDNPRASAEDVYNHLNSQAVQQGTLDKVGKFIWGKNFEQPLGNTQTADDRISSLQGQLAHFKDQMNDMQLKNAMLNTENMELKKQLAVYQSQEGTKRIAASEKK